MSAWRTNIWFDKRLKLPETMRSHVGHWRSQYEYHHNRKEVAYCQIRKIGGSGFSMHCGIFSSCGVSAYGGLQRWWRPPFNVWPTQRKKMLCNWKWFVVLSNRQWQLWGSFCYCELCSDQCRAAQRRNVGWWSFRWFFPHCMMHLSPPMWKVDVESTNHSS